MNTHSLNMLKKIVKLVKISQIVLVLLYNSTSKLAKVRGHSKESTQLDVYIFRKIMAKSI